MNFRNASIADKISAGSKIIIAILAIAEISLFFSLRELDQTTREQTISQTARAEVEKCIATVEDQIASARGYIITSNPRFVKSYDNAVKAQLDTLNAARTTAEGSPEVIAALHKLEAAAAAYRNVIGDPEMEFARDPKTIDKAIDLAKNEQAAELRRNIRSAAAEAQDRISAWLQRSQSVQNWTTNTIHIALLSFALVTLVFSLLIRRFLSNGIAKPLSDMAEAMDSLARGDDRVVVPCLGQPDEMGQMAASVETFKQNAIERKRLEAEAIETRRVVEADRNAREIEKTREAEDRQQAISLLGQGLGRLANGDLMHRIETPFAQSTDELRAGFNISVDQLRQTMLTIISNTAAIRSGTGEISAAADDLSRRTEQQAANLEETAAALDQITATVRRTAEGATHARDVVSSAKSEADKSGEVVRLAIAAMSGIEKSSQQISQIIGVIDEIAFQTNLLALNAGVEAARAGEAGRGFAVVASEVRALAQRSAEAAKEIKRLISASTAQVDQGVDLVAETGKALERIVDQVCDINNVVSEIAASAHEQATGLKEVNVAINQMDQVTQQNAAMVEETTAAARSLNRETEKLTDLINRFHVGGAGSIDVGTRQIATKHHAAVPTLKSVSGRGGSAALRKSEVTADAGWEEF
jgi:methyl-accepting chemotaxis protein